MIYRIQNEHLCVNINEIGAEIVSVKNSNSNEIYELKSKINLGEYSKISEKLFKNHELTSTLLHFKHKDDYVFNMIFELCGKTLTQKFEVEKNKERIKTEKKEYKF